MIIYTTTFMAKNQDNVYSNEEEQESNSDSVVDDVHTLTVSYDGLTTTLPIRADESILSALERSGQLLGLSSLPSDCRQGNCLTCVATHASSSTTENILRDLNGLSPNLARYIKQEGYVLTCSSRVCGSGVSLQLGKCHEVWTDVYQLRLKSRDVQESAMAAMAKTIRQSNERNIQRWKDETETLLK